MMVNVAKSTIHGSYGYGDAELLGNGILCSTKTPWSSKILETHLFFFTPINKKCWLENGPFSGFEHGDIPLLSQMFNLWCIYLHLPQKLLTCCLPMYPLNVVYQRVDVDVVNVQKTLATEGLLQFTLKFSRGVQCKPLGMLPQSVTMASKG